MLQTEKGEQIELDDRNLEFYHRLIALLVTVIEEDINNYSPVLNQ